MGLIKILLFIINHPISSHSKIRSLVRFFWWQVRSIFTKEIYVHQFTEHSKLLMTKGMTGATGNLYCGLHEYKEMLFLLHYLRENEIFVDAGANIGSYSILASAEIGATSYSFEPVEETFNQFQQNINVNNISSKVNCFQIGLASKPGELIFTDEQDSSMNHVLTSNNSSKNAKRVEVSTLDSILKNYSPSLLKIDVEGFELEVLNGALETLNKQSLKAIIIELNGSGKNYGFSDEEINSKLLSLGFNSYTYNPFERKLIAARLNDFDNLIFIRDIEFVESKLVSAPKVKILNLEI